MPTESKWFRVAVEGDTTDGRDLARQDIVDMAETYDPNTFGARVNLEHFRGIFPDGPFDRLGDVLALRSQEDEINLGGKTEKKLALYCQIQPLDNLVALNKKGQKIYTSIEVQPNFAKTGKAYMMGLAVTDDPASLGTNVLKFSSANPEFFAKRKTAPDCFFSEARETEMLFSQIPETAETANLLSGLVEFFSKIKSGESAGTENIAAPPAPPTPPAQNLNDESVPQTEAQFGSQFAALADGMTQMTKVMSEAVDNLQKAQKENSDNIESLKKSLESAPQNQYSQRPPVSGGADRLRATC